mmetsp:Transcript_117941/g.333587  ORF Transcript_117941/g.333587 Transcript_117941/m.333587 type:complete len:665 (-) Transcript_117941:82-2076(-)
MSLTLQSCRILSVESVFECVSQVFGQSGPGAAHLVNCSTDSKREQAWALSLTRFAEGTGFELPLFETSQYCLGVQAGIIGTYLCGVDPNVTSWRWSNVSRSDLGMFYLSHTWTGQCLKRVPLGLGHALAMHRCPAPALANSTVDGHDASAVSFMWVPVAFAQLIPDEELPLRSVGNDIVGASGHVVRLRGINWYGAYMPQHVNGGLDRLTAEEITRVILNMGFNHVRMNFGTQQLFENPPVDPKLVTANPDLIGLRSMEVFDRNIETLTAHGLLVIVNNHVTTSSWCCKVDDGNSMWFNRNWTETQWYTALTKIGVRYKGNKRVIGVDLRNEPRPDMQDQDAWIVPWWGRIDGVASLTADWKTAAQEGAKAVWLGNPDALVFVEGNLGLDLSSATSQKIEFGQECLQSRLVYSVHDYVWFYRWIQIVLSLDSAGALNLYQQLVEAAQVVHSDDPAAEKNYEEFEYQRDAVWGYLEKEDISPIWIGEMGTADRNVWWSYFLRYASSLDLDWSYWPLNGYKWPANYGPPEGNRSVNEEQGDWYGLLTADFKQVRMAWKLSDLTPMLMEAGVRDSVRELPRECVFEPSMNVVGPSGSESGVLTFQQLETIVALIAASVLLCITVCFAAFCCACRRRWGGSGAYRTMRRTSYEDTDAEFDEGSDSVDF